MVVLEPIPDSESIVDLPLKFRAAGLRGQLLNVSMGGAALLLPEQLSPGESRFVQMSNWNRDITVIREATVTACEPAAAGGWKHFCRFADRLTFEEISELGHAAIS